MKKILLALLAGLMIFSFSACGNTADNAKDTQNNNATTEDVTSGADLEAQNDEPRYTSDGELIVEEELPASDSDLTE